MWRAVVAAAGWTNFAQLKADFPSADYVSPFTVFNVKGNKYRLITLVDYTECIIVVRDVLTPSAGTLKPHACGQFKTARLRQSDYCRND